MVEKINFVNYANDRYDTFQSTTINHPAYFYYTYSFVDAMACAICNIVAFSAVIGRIRMLEVFFLSLIGTFIYQIN